MLRGERHTPRAFAITLATASPSCTLGSLSSARTGNLLATGAAFWAAAFFIPFQAAGQQAPQAHVVLAMLTCAAAFNSVTALLRPRALRVDRLSLAVSVALGVLTLVGNLAVMQAVVELGAALTSVTLQTQVLIVAVVAHFALRERITAPFVTGAVVAIGGFAIMRMSAATTATVTTSALLYALVAALSFALMHVLTRRVIDRIQPVVVNALRLWVASAALAVVHGGDVAALSGEVWLLAAAAAFFGPFIARVCIMYAVRHIPASRAALVSMVTPIFAFAMGFAAFGDVPAPLELLGAAIILAGVGFPQLVETLR